MNDDDENDDIFYSYCTEQKAKRIEDDLSVLCSLNEYVKRSIKYNWRRPCSSSVFSSAPVYSDNSRT